jgi:hypothetical protein
MECVLCVDLVTCRHDTMMTHLYVLKKKKKKGSSQWFPALGARSRSNTNPELCTDLSPSLAFSGST